MKTGFHLEKALSSGRGGEKSAKDDSRTGDPEC